MIQLTAPAWHEQAICAQTDPEEFFPDKGGSTAIAKRICNTCPVQAECLDHALIHQEQFGIWGGTSERERRRMLDELVNDNTDPVEDIFTGDFSIDQTIEEAS